jgi:uncharacterized protein (DUF302 family)
MLKHAPEVGLYDSVRIYVYEDEQGTARIDYDKVSPILERYGSEETNEVARGLDQMLE